MSSQVQFNCLSSLPLLFHHVLEIAKNRVYCLLITGFSDLIALNMKDVILRKLDLLENSICN